MYIFLHYDSENKQKIKKKKKQNKPYQQHQLVPPGKDKTNKQTKTLPVLISLFWNLVFFHVKFVLYMYKSEIINISARRV